LYQSAIPPSGETVARFVVADGGAWFQGRTLLGATDGAPAVQHAIRPLIGVVLSQSARSQRIFFAAQ